MIARVMAESIFASQLRVRYPEDMCLSDSALVEKHVEDGQVDTLASSLLSVQDDELQLVEC